MHLVDARLLGKVDLPPALGAAQLPDSLAGCRTDVPCHASMIGLAFALYLAHTLFGSRKATSMPLPGKIPFAFLFLIALLAPGCGGKSGGTGSTTSTPTYPSITGNWSLAASSQVTSQTFLMGGYLTNTDGTVSGTLHILNSPCYSLTEDVPFTGTITTAGAFSATSTQIASQTITVSGTISGSTLSSGTYSITGGCANGDKGTVTGYIVPPFTNTYTGTFVSGLTSVGVSVTTSQSGPTSDGIYQVTGSATFTGSPCFSSGTITASEIAGGYMEVTISTPNGGTLEFAGEITNSSGKTITVTYEVTAGTCAGNSGSGSLSAVAGTGGTITSVSVACSPASILTTQTSACAATVQGTGSYSSAVTWTATDGTITSAGVFTPSGVGTAVITATSTQDVSESGTASVVVGTATGNNGTITSVSVACSPASILTTQTSACTATVSGTGSFSSAVSWSLSPSSIGSVSSTGVFAPATTGTASITATSTQDATISGSTAVTVTSQTTTVYLAGFTSSSTGHSVAEEWQIASGSSTATATALPLPSGTTSSNATAIAVSGGNVYVAGYA